MLHSCHAVRGTSHARTGRICEVQPYAGPSEEKRSHQTRRARTHVPTPLPQAAVNPPSHRSRRQDELRHLDDGTLVIRTSAEIVGAVPGTHRPTLVVVDDVSFHLVGHTRDDSLHVYNLAPWRPGPFDREGSVVIYDPDRVLKARRQRWSFAARALCMMLLLPASPLIGLLPEAAKDRLRERGVIPPATQTSSLLLEWILLYALAAAELLAVIFSAVGVAVVFGCLALVVMVDIMHRVSWLAEGRDVGMLAWPREFLAAWRQKLPAEDIVASSHSDHDRALRRNNPPNTDVS